MLKELKEKRPELTIILTSYTLLTNKSEFGFDFFIIFLLK